MGDNEEMVPCPAKGCDNGICGLCGGVGEVAREIADDYLREKSAGAADTKRLAQELLDACVGQPAKIPWPHRVLHNAADLLLAQEAEIERLRRTVKAAGTIGEILGYLGDDEARISLFLECLGPDEISRARAAFKEKTDG